jgi:hypothetical protein
MATDSESEIPIEGVLYIATNEQYVREVFRSAETLKEHTDLHCTLITDEPLDHDCIDLKIHGDNPPDRPDGYYKLNHIHRSPYDRTLYLDTDTYVREDISDLFAILDKFDLAVTQAPIRNTGRVSDIPAWFPEYNCGVMLFRTYDTGLEFFREWRENYDTMEFDQDQPSFRRTLFDRDDIRYFTMMREYNVRFWPGYVDERVKIIHTHYDNEAIATAFESTTGARAYHYDEDKNIVIETNRHSLSIRAKRLVVRARRSLREDGLVSTAKKAAAFVAQAV